MDGGPQKLDTAFPVPFVQFCKIPRLTGKTGKAYQEQHPDRIKTFLDAELQDFDKILEKEKALRGKDGVRQHPDLYHDAESIFWMLLWWIANAVPATETEVSSMDFHTWVSMQGNQCMKWDTVMHHQDYLGMSVHPAYQPLEELIFSFGDHFL